MLEKKSAWPFDFYQQSEFYPVDYYYYWSPFTTSTGKSQMTTMHASAIAEDGSLFSADQMQHRISLREAHKHAMHQFYRDEPAKVFSKRKPSDF